MSRRTPTAEDRVAAMRHLFDGLRAGEDAIEIARNVVDLHPKNDTFPGEVYVQVGAESLRRSGATAETPIPMDGLLAGFLPEQEFRGRENRKIRYALFACSSTCAGLEPDLLDEVSWWQTDDFWRYALGAAIALTRAGAAHRGIPVTAFVDELELARDDA
jgi:hypothetical protein